MITKLGKSLSASGPRKGSGIKDRYVKTVAPLIGASFVKNVTGVPILLAAHGASELSGIGTERQIHDMALNMGNTSKINFTNSEGLLGKIQAHYVDNKITTPKNLGIAAHELGHATGFKGLHYGTIPSRLLGMPAMLAAANAGVIERDAKDTGRQLTDSEKWQIRGADVSQAAKAFPLLEEARASIRGYNGLKKTFGKSVARKSIPGLLAAFATYGANAASPYLLREYIKRKKVE